MSRFFPPTWRDKLRDLRHLKAYAPHLMDARDEEELGRLEWLAFQAAQRRQEAQTHI